jgi:hypothetical protein
MRAFLVTALAAFALAAPALAQTAPPTDGPYLFAAEEDGLITVLAMGTRVPAAGGDSATAITFMSYEGTRIRGDATIQADCAQGLRRSSEIHVYIADDPDVRSARMTVAPGLDWTPWGPLDGPFRDFLCNDGAHDPAQVRAKASQHVNPWWARISQ